MLSATSSTNASMATATAAAASRRACCSSSSSSFAASRGVAMHVKQVHQARAFVAAALSQAARLRGGTTIATSTTTRARSSSPSLSRPRRSLFSTASLPRPAPALLGPEAGIACGLSAPSARSLSKWLAFCAAWTFSMVVLGGVTRLTRSGLSMTSWSFAGERPPMSAEGWEEEFDNYKRHPVS